MCRSANHESPYTDDGGDGNVLKIRAFFVHIGLSASGFNGNPGNADPLPQFLTLVFLPPNPTLSLYRLVNHPLPHPHVIFGAGIRQRLRATQGLCTFQLYFGKAKQLLKGVFIKEDDHHWRLECRSRLPSHSRQISEAQLCVALEFDDGHVSMNHRVVVKPKEKIIIKHCINARGWELEQIPEEKELHYYNAHASESDVQQPGSGVILDFEPLRWALDLGIWVVCLGLGVGYLVSKASIRKFRPS